VLIDGPFVQERHTDLRWRGSDNQRVWFLSPRYQNLAAMAEERGTWIEFEVDDGTLRWMGIPPPGFREALPRALERLGIGLRVGD
jgi:anaerobic ribonucleoside-triphosphate reductase activating protein